MKCNIKMLQVALHRLTWLGLLLAVSRANPRSRRGGGEGVDRPMDCTRTRPACGFLLELDRFKAAADALVFVRPRERLTLYMRATR